MRLNSDKNSENPSSEPVENGIISQLHEALPNRGTLEKFRTQTEILLEVLILSSLVSMLIWRPTGTTWSSLLLIIWLAVFAIIVLALIVFDLWLRDA